MRHISFTLPEENHEQLVELSKELHISKSAVLRQAIARFHFTEPLIKEKSKEENGSSSTRVHR